MEKPDPELPGRRMKEGDGEQRLVFLNSGVRDQAQTQQHKQKTGEARHQVCRNIRCVRLFRMRIFTAQCNSIRQGPETAAASETSGAATAPTKDVAVTMIWKG